MGWYHSHTRSEIFLSDADLKIHQAYFPESWQVALVMKPHTLQPARIGFFFREADGSVHASASYREEVPGAAAGPANALRSACRSASPNDPASRRFRQYPVSEPVPLPPKSLRCPSPSPCLSPFGRLSCRRRRLRAGRQLAAPTAPLPEPAAPPPPALRSS